jgi:hypothetical protein
MEEADRQPQRRYRGQDEGYTFNTRFQVAF